MSIITSTARFYVKTSSGMDLVDCVSWNRVAFHILSPQQSHGCTKFAGEVYNLIPFVLSLVDLLLILSLLLHVLRPRICQSDKLCLVEQAGRGASRP